MRFERFPVNLITSTFIHSEAFIAAVTLFQRGFEPVPPKYALGNTISVGESASPDGRCTVKLLAGKD